MRRAGRVEIHRSEEGVLQAVFLAAGGCGEHERGIGRLLAASGVPPYDDGTTVGIEGRSATGPVGPALFAFEERVSAIRCGSERGTRRMPYAVLVLANDAAEVARRYARDGRKSFWEPEIPNADWSDDGLAIEAVGEVNVAVLRSLAEGMRTGDLAVWYGTITRNPFDRPGISIARPSLVEAANRDTMRDHDLSRIEFADLVASIGIEERFEAAQDDGALPLPSGYRGYGRPEIRVSSALRSVMRDGETFELRSEHPVSVFVRRPHDGLVGWYTVEEVDDWIEGRGPLMPAAPAPMP